MPIQDAISRITRTGAAAAALAVLALAPATAGAAPITTGHSSWSWSDPVPQGQDLGAVAYSGQTGYAAGGFGTVLRTADGGASWTGLDSGLTQPLTLVDEVSPSVVAVAGNCHVAVSSDSGAIFTPIPLELGLCQTDVAGIFFSDAQHGLIALADGSVMATSNGGQTLSARPSIPVGAGSELTGLDFLTPTTGLATTTGGRIYRTTDGGNSWSVVDQQPQTLTAVTTVDQTHAYAVGAGGTLLGSSDAGATWQPAKLALGTGVTPPDYIGITCSGLQDCVMTTNGGLLVRTADGGQSGTIVTVGGAYLAAAAFSTGTALTAVGAGGVTVNSADGGVTFPAVTVDPLAGFIPDGGIVAGGAPGTAYQPGEHGTIAATTNAGASWTALRVPAAGQVDQVAFPSAQTGYALVGQGTLFATHDGGASWQSFAGAHAPGPLVTSGGALLLFGPAGGIQRSTDGGRSFAAVTGRVRTAHGPGSSLATLKLFGAQARGSQVIAWGNRTIVVSSDGGRSWRSVPAPASGAVTSVDFLSPRRIWAVDPHAGAVYATTDGGRDWHALYGVGGVEGVTQVSFSSPRDGVAALAGASRVPGDGPFATTSVLATHDGGRTWQPELINGEDGGGVLATPQADLAWLTGTSPGAPLSGLFSTTGGGTTGAPRALRLTLPGRRGSTAAALAKAGHTVTLRGHLADPGPAEQVLISYRAANARSWKVKLARIATGGAFSVQVPGITTSTVFVAQAAGDGLHGGAGTAPQTLAVTS